MNISNEDIEKLLEQFTPITLDEMDGVRLLNRTDTKFTFHINQLPFYLEHLAPNYHVLAINQKRISKYESLYLDTEEFHLYNLHHNGKLNRHKIRFRKYIDSNLVYFEIKFKNSCGRTIKQRTKLKEGNFVANKKAIKLLNQHTNYQMNMLHPKLFIYYSRITLVSNNLSERVTIDINLNFKKDSFTQSFNQLVIAEVKQGHKEKSVFFRLMKDNHILPIAISKYCLGVVSTNPEIKKNNFKAKILHIHKIINSDKLSHNEINYNLLSHTTS